MSLAAALSVPCLLAAAVLSALGPRFAVAARVLAAASALLLLTLVESPSSWPFLALALGASALASPLPCVLATAGATLAAVRPDAAGLPLAAVVLALGAAAAAGAVSSSVRAQLETGADPARLAALAGFALVVLLLTVDGGRVLRWSFGLGGGGGRLELPGASLLLGLALLACLGGTLLLLAHSLAPAVSGARLLGLRLLLPGATLAALAAAHTGLRGFLRQKEALAAGADSLAALVLLTSALAVALVRVWASDASSPVDGRLAERETAVAAALAWVAVTAAAWGGWRDEGTYLTREAATMASGGLIGLAAIVETRLPGARRLLLFATLAATVLFPEALR